MSSTRSKLMLDEQSFQGLLAAAFTIQQHNDRQRALGLNSGPGDEVASVQATDLCRHCGVPIPTGRTACVKCGGDDFRPGERLQRTWASMWMMSQEKSLGADTGSKELDQSEADSQSVGSGSEASGGDHAEPPPASAPALAQAQPITFNRMQEARPEAAEKIAIRPRFSGGAFLDGPRLDAARDASKKKVSQGESATSIENRRNTGRDAASSVFWRQNDPPVDHQTSEDIGGGNPALKSPASDDIGGEEVSLDISPAHYLSANDSVSRAASSNANAIRRGLLDLQVKLRFHRADLYLGVALVVAFLALLWPATASQRPTLHPWERILIAMGIAEAPTPAVHYPGNPNIKVWVDTHTALYYCPGDELYGKSQDGHYSTQHEAQLDRFEPAERVTCVE